MLIPNDFPADIPWEKNSARSRPMSTLFLLHGYTGKAGNWVPEGLPEKYNFAIVMPTAENSFYLNGEATGSAYQTMVGEELVDYVRKTFHLANSPEDTCIAGLSMGGFGALHTGLAYPDRFGKIGALSSALIVREVATMKPGGGYPVAGGAEVGEGVGDDAPAEGVSDEDEGVAAAGGEGPDVPREPPPGGVRVPHGLLPELVAVPLPERALRRREHVGEAGPRAALGRLRAHPA